MNDEQVTFPAQIIGHSAKAIHVEFVDATGKEVRDWFPRSQILEQTETELTVPQWLAEDKGVV